MQTYRYIDKRFLGLQNGNLLFKKFQIPIEEDGGVNKGANNSIACQGTVVVRLRAGRLQVQRKISKFPKQKLIFSTSLKFWNTLHTCRMTINREIVTQ